MFVTEKHRFKVNLNFFSDLDCLVVSMAALSLKQSLIFNKWQNQRHSEFGDIQLQEPC
jgi:hypothetical protein